MTATVQSVRQEGLDKFYTVPSVVDKCLTTLTSLTPWTSYDFIVEPSAGNGSFFTKIPVTKKAGLDISPEHPEILRQDFFTYTPPSESKKILVVGNPPFGRKSSIAIKFFQHASQWAQTIAFIVPRTFRRTSVQNRLNLSFHLLHDEDIPMEPCSFLPPMTAKCCFQIWERRESKRCLVAEQRTHPHWNFLSLGPLNSTGQPTMPVGADFALRAYGGKCGEIVSTDLETLVPKNWHWIQCKTDKEMLKGRFVSLDYSRSYDTARQNSLGRADLVELYRKSFP